MENIDITNQDNKAFICNMVEIIQNLPSVQQTNILLYSDTDPPEKLGHIPGTTGDFILDKYYTPSTVGGYARISSHKLPVSIHRNVTSFSIQILMEEWIRLLQAEHGLYKGGMLIPNRYEYIAVEGIITATRGLSPSYIPHKHTLRAIDGNGSEFAIDASQRVVYGSVDRLGHLPLGIQHKNLYEPVLWLGGVLAVKLAEMGHLETLPEDFTTVGEGLDMFNRVVRLMASKFEVKNYFDHRTPMMKAMA